MAIGGAAVLAVPVVAAAVALSGRGTPASAAADGHVVRVVERDFRIAVSPSHAAAGLVTFKVTNDGPDAHEMIVVRDNGKLPLRADGMTVNEDALARQTVGALEPGEAGDVRHLRLRLRPGRYMLLCNMYGHYMAGMHSVVLVGR